MKQTIMKKYAALLATFCLCAALAPGLAFAVEEEYQAGSLADGTEVTTQAEGENYSAAVSPSALELTVGYAADASSTLTAAVVSTGTVNNMDKYDITYQWYSTTSGIVPSGPAAGTIIEGEKTETYAPDKLQAGTYYYYCVATMTKTGEEPKVLTSSVATVTVKNRTVPDNVEAINETLEGEKDGAIVNVTKDMQWRPQSSNGKGSWTDCDSTTIEQLGQGKYEVRLKAIGDLEASDPVLKEVGLDAKTKINIGSNAPTVKVPNLNDLALNIKASSDIDDKSTVALYLDVNAIASNSNDADVQKIKNAASNKTLTCFSMLLTQSIDSGKATELTDLENDVLEINVEYTTKDRNNIVAYRVHDGKAEAFKSLSKKPESGFTDGTYYVGDGTVTIYSSKFSTYALGYDTKAAPANENANTTPATGDTLPGVVPFAILAAIAIIAMVVARRFIRKTW